MTDCGYCDKCTITNIDTSALTTKNWTLRGNERCTVKVTIGNGGWLPGAVTLHGLAGFAVAKGASPTGTALYTWGTQYYKTSAVSMLPFNYNFDIYAQYITGHVEQDLYVECFPYGKANDSNLGQYRKIGTVRVEQDGGFIASMTASVSTSQVAPGTKFSIPISFTVSAPVENAAVQISFDGDHQIGQKVFLWDNATTYHTITVNPLNGSRSHTKYIGLVSGTQTLNVIAEIPGFPYIGGTGTYNLKIAVGTQTTTFSEHRSKNITFTCVDGANPTLKTRVNFTSTPSGAAVTVAPSAAPTNGTTLTTPGSADLERSQSYTVYATLPGYKPFSGPLVTDASSSDRSFPIILTPESGTDPTTDPTTDTTQCRFANGKLTVWNHDGTNWQDSGEACTGIPTCVVIPGLESQGCISTPIVIAGAAVLLFLLMGDRQ